MADDDKRPIAPGSCTWCGHDPHDGACTRSIRTRVPMPHGSDVTVPCACARREGGRG